MAQCGTRTRDGTPCGNLVPQEGMRCFRHEETEEASRRLAVRLAKRDHRPDARSPASTRWWELQLQDRLESAVSACLRLVTSEQWRYAVASRVTYYASDKTWNALLISARRDHCAELAVMASGILTTKRLLHGLARRMTVLLGMGRVERRFAGELAKKIPLSTTVKPTAVARGLQVTGVLLCLADGRDLTQCPCFVDLAQAEVKQRVRQILVAGANDWVNLARFPATTPKGLIKGGVRPE